ncbi:MAG: 2-oxoisovalerate dehydrogenase [Desulfurobacterium sp.]|nr:MAG: 2-oxoisovalerate dehydrogenase [Desulfurobacterium sp.]
MTKEIIFLVEEDPEGGYFARALGYSIFTQGETIEELKQNVKDALECHFERKEDGFIKLGTLNAILKEVAVNLKMSKKELIEKLFG